LGILSNVFLEKTKFHFLQPARYANFAYNSLYPPPVQWLGYRRAFHPRSDAKLKWMPSEPANPTSKPQTGWRAILRIVSGFGLLLIGIIGLILPVMPGWVFIIPGLMILSDYFPPVKRLLDWAKSKYEAVRDRNS
jgi:hypothetical protein